MAVRDSGSRRLAQRGRDRQPERQENHGIRRRSGLCRGQKRLQWRKRDWPRSRAKPLGIRQAPHRRDDARHETHQGSAGIVSTGSKYVLRMSRDRLSRFLVRLFGLGISVDRYLPGSEEMRAAARALTPPHPFLTLHAPVGKPSIDGDPPRLRYRTSLGAHGPEGPRYQVLHFVRLEKGRRFTQPVSLSPMLATLVSPICLTMSAPCSIPLIRSRGGQADGCHLGPCRGRTKSSRRPAGSSC